MTNKFDLLNYSKLKSKTKSELEKDERFISSLVVEKLKTNPIKGNFDFKHLKEIHKEIFKDIYTFAGKDRNEMGLPGTFGKGNTLFCSGEMIPSYQNEIFSKLKKQNNLKNCKSSNQFAKAAADFLSDLNALHPFREGNGRTQRIFIEQLAQNAGYKLDLSNVPKEKMIKASELGMLKNNLKLEAIIKANLKPGKSKKQQRGISL